MRSALLVGLVAGSAISAAAYAGDDLNLVPVPASVIRVVPREAYTGPLYPKDAGSRDTGAIYDNTNVTYITSWSGSPVKVLDDVTLRPGNASPLPGNLITAMTFGMYVGGTAGGTRDFDVLVEFFDTFNSAAAINTNCWTGSLGAFRVGFTGLSQATYYTAGPINLTTLSGGGIATLDDGFGVQFTFVATGTTTPLTAPLVYPYFSYQFDAANSAFNIQTNGTSAGCYWADRDLDGFIESGTVTTEQVQFVAPGQARIYMKLEGSARCPADYNNDGFVDGMDADMFNTDFETLCF